MVFELNRYCTMLNNIEYKSYVCGMSVFSAEVSKLVLARRINQLR